jgi:hypothetical protein
MSLYLSYVKTKYFLLFDKDPEKFEDTKEVIRIRKSKNRQHNCQNKKYKIRVITKLPNSEQSYKGKVKTHNYINRQNQSTTGKL